MILHKLDILNYKNIHEASLVFSDKLNCFVGLNGQGKTNILDAIYLLSFTKSALSALDNQAICNETDMAMVQGLYSTDNADEELTISCGLKRGHKKVFRRDKKDYKRLQDHIGLIPLVMVAPEDNALVAEGSDERRRYMDVVLAQEDRTYLEKLSQYNSLLKQRNALLKLLSERNDTDTSMLEVYELQMAPLADYIYQARSRFIRTLLPIFQQIHSDISGRNETVQLSYRSQLQNRNLNEAFLQTRERDLILGWTSQGIHKDELEMTLSLPAANGEKDELPLKRVGSQGQQKTFMIAMKLAQAVYLATRTNTLGQAHSKPILLLDDVFDKLDSERVERIIRLVISDTFGQIFFTDTDRQHLSRLVEMDERAKIFTVSQGVVS